MSFKLDEKFLANYIGKPHAIDKDPLAVSVLLRTYSRTKPDGGKETFAEIIKRVVEYAMTVLLQRNAGRNKELEQEVQVMGQEMYEVFYEMKALPPGRGLYAMGTGITDKRLYAACNNCAFISTNTLHLRQKTPEYSDVKNYPIPSGPMVPFAFLMDHSMCGVGVGFDNLGEGAFKITKPVGATKYVIPDTREGWVCSLCVVLQAFFEGGPLPEFDYSQLRKKGVPLKIFGGVSSGPGPLAEMHEEIVDILTPCIGKHITSRNITDIMNSVGKAVVSGNVRRSAEIALGAVDDEDFMSLKNMKLEKNKYRSPYFWTSNNSLVVVNTDDAASESKMARSVSRAAKRDKEDMRSSLRSAGAASARSSFRSEGDPSDLFTLAGTEVKTGEPRVGLDDDAPQFSAGKAASKPTLPMYTAVEPDYDAIGKSIALNGEPGLIFLSNMRNYSRMPHEKDYRDHRATGCNPCSEQTLESGEMCCLVETFPASIHSMDEWTDKVLKYAFLYAKIVSTLPSHWPMTEEILRRNRRIGTSMSGVAQFVAKNGLGVLKEWCQAGYTKLKEYDVYFSELLGVNQSIKITSIKPSGTVSLLTGATPGIHYPISRLYIRRVTYSIDDPQVRILKKAGYHVEPSVYTPGSVVAEIPVDSGEGIRAESEVTMWEQLAMTAFMQEHWADNQVSVTIKFHKHEAKDIPHALRLYADKLKSVSMLPQDAAASYKQLPYEPIDEKRYLDIKSKITTPDFARMYTSIGSAVGDAEMELYCDGDQCTRPVKLEAKSSS